VGPTVGAAISGDPRMILRGSSALYDAFTTAYGVISEQGQPARMALIKDRFIGRPMAAFGLRFVEPIADVSMRLEYVTPEGVQETKEQADTWIGSGRA
jgi:hypothetical protein